jgi:hypothetical protein
MMRSHARPASGLAPASCGRPLAAAAATSAVGRRRRRRCGVGVAASAASAASVGATRLAAAAALAPVADARTASGADCSTSGRGADAGPPLPAVAVRRARWALSGAAAARRGAGTAAAARRGGGGDGVLLGPEPPRELWLAEAGRDANGDPQYVALDPSDWAEFDPPLPTDELLDGLDGVDGGFDAATRAAADADAEEAEVPAMRVIDDPVELDLIGDGLPIIHGVRGGGWEAAGPGHSAAVRPGRCGPAGFVRRRQQRLSRAATHHPPLYPPPPQEEWPKVYWDALRRVASHGGRRGVEVPSPHPKFSASDMERIAAAGPRFGDVVLEHAERVNEGGRPAAGASGAWSVDRQRRAAGQRARARRTSPGPGSLLTTHCASRGPTCL